MSENRLEVGIDAMDFIKDIPDQYWDKIDTVVWDPPYYDDDNPEHIEKVNQRSKLKDKKVQWDKQQTRIMNKEKRENIFNYIKSKTDDIHMIHFHMVREELKIENVGCEHVWVKPINGTMAGNCDRNNGEYIVIEGKKIEGKLKGRIINKYINAKFKRLNPPRSCAKPTFLYKELFRHLNSKFILDPFAGYGGSIKAANEMNIPIFACDIDDTLLWDKQTSIEDWLEVE